MSSYLISGIILGLSAGFAPGPLLTLVVSETLIHNRKEGFKIAIAPLLSDIPIVIISILFISNLEHFHLVIGLIYLLGGIFIFYLGYENFKTKGMKLNENQIVPQSIKKGFLVNILSPHPYLFWITIGAPLTLKAYNISLYAAIGFIISFYFFLISSKIVIAVLVERSKNFINSEIYLFIMKLLGLVLFFFSIIFIKDGIKMIYETYFLS